MLNSVCDGFPGAILNPYPCAMTYNANETGSWVVALKFEDFQFSSQTIPMSISSVQFIITVSNTSLCTTRMNLFDIYLKKSLFYLKHPFIMVNNQQMHAFLLWFGKQ
jgi:hypothetical protein